jgi:hypothetical protein
MAHAPAKAKVIEEARWLLSAYDDDFEELAQSDFTLGELPGGNKVRDRGDYQRWMLDVRGWAMEALRASETVEDDPYRDGQQTKVDRGMKDAASAALEAVTKHDPRTIRATLAAYLQTVG